MSATPKRRWFAFRLRTLIVVVVVVACVLTPLAIKVKKTLERKQVVGLEWRKAVAWVLENGGTELDLKGTEVSDLTPLQVLTNLRELYL